MARTDWAKVANFMNAALEDPNCHLVVTIENPNRMEELQVTILESHVNDFLKRLTLFEAQVSNTTPAYRTSDL